ncbi:YfjI family protein [Enterobacter sp. UPMP2076]|uniref:YfjI family protein n=1 Tax=Enterobacter ludwigii TaxID=299767 RepID=UPI003BC61EB2
MTGYPEKNQPHGSKSDYPVESLPTVLRNVVASLNEDTGIPVELIGSAVLSAASLACQALIEVVSPHNSQPEQCSLYLLTIAESGEGKTTVHKRIMSLFHEFSQKMDSLYKGQYEEYETELDIWKTKNKGLQSALRKASKDRDDTQIYEDEIKALNKTKPIKPKRLRILYENITSAALIRGLIEYPNAAIISDEAISFFQGYVKNEYGFLNKAWEGSTYSFERRDFDGVSVNACMTMGLMVQSDVFKDYLKKNGSLAHSSGFLSRFLITEVESSRGQRKANVSHAKSDSAIQELHYRIDILLARQARKFSEGDNEKISMILSDDAMDLWLEMSDYINERCSGDGCFEHIKETAAKAMSNVIRLAAIFQLISPAPRLDLDEYTDKNDSGLYLWEKEKFIDREILNNAFVIIEWHLFQTSRLFHYRSKRYQLEQDVYELFSHIKKQFIELNKFEVSVRDLENSGPGRLRKKSILMPVLEQLISTDVIYLYGFSNFEAKNKIAMCLNGKHYGTPNGVFTPFAIRSSDVKALPIEWDWSKLM